MTTSNLDIAVRVGTRTIQPVQVLTNGAVVSLPGDATAKMQLRANAKSEIVLVELNTTNGGLTIDPTLALLTIDFKSAVTAAFDFERAVYDVELIYSDSEKDTIVEGKVYVFPSVTR